MNPLLLVQRSWEKLNITMFLVLERKAVTLPIPFLKPAKASAGSSGCFAEGGCAYLLYEFPGGGGGQATEDCQSEYLGWV